MNKKFSKVLAVIIALMMLFTSSPVNMIAFAEIDIYSADFLTFNVTDGGAVSQGTTVTLYSGSDVVASDVTNQNGIVEFILLTPEQLQSVTRAEVGSKVVSGPFTVRNYYVEINEVNSYEDPMLSVGSTAYSVVYADTVNVNATTVSDAAIQYASSDLSVVTVDSEGNVTAVGTGTATVEVKVAFTNTYAEAIENVTFNVAPSDKAIKGFRLSGGIGSAEEGKTYYNPVILAQDAQGTVTYSSSDINVATVDNNGNVTYRSLGDKAVITATFTPAEGSANYTAASATYEISSTYVVKTPVANEQQYINSGSFEITVNTGDVVTFSVDDDAKRYAAESKNGVFVIDIGISQIPEGQHTISIYINDVKAGSHYVYKDTIAPGLELPEFADKWVSSFSLNAVVTEDENAQDSEIKSVNGVFGSATLIGQKVSDGKYVISSNGSTPDGAKNLYVTVTDEAGNSTTKSVRIKHDSTADEFEVKGFALNDAEAKKWLSDTETEFVIEIDSEKEADRAPVDKVTYKIGDNEKTISAQDDIYSFRLKDIRPEDGENQVVITVTDKAGNKKENTLHVFYDSVEPVVSLEKSYTSEWINSAEGNRINVTATDDLSGISKLTYNIHYKTDINSDSYSVSDNLEVLDNKINIADILSYIGADGKCTINVTAVDNVGNSTTASIDVFYDDTAPETGRFEFSYKNDTNAAETANKLTYGQFFNAAIVVTVEVDDDQSGVKAENIKLVATPENEAGSYTVDAKSYKDGVATFELNHEVFGKNEEDSVIFTGSVSVKAENDAQLTANVKADASNSDTYGTITWETVAPDVDIDMSASTKIEVPVNENQDVAAENAYDWYSDVNAKISYSDNASEISKIKISVNDVAVYNFVAESNLRSASELYVKFAGESNLEKASEKLQITVLDANGNQLAQSNNLAFPDDYVYSIKAEIVDGAGNMTVVTETFMALANVYTQFDSSAPAILFSMKDEGEQDDKFSSPNGKWFNEDITFTVFAFDAQDEYQSGIASMTVSASYITAGNEEVNEILFSKGNDNESDSISNICTYAVDTAKLRVSSEYTITVEATDYSGNTTTQSIVVYIDRLNPIVTDITITKVEKQESDTENILNALTFGLFHNNDFVVTVTGTDNTDDDGNHSSSGIAYYTLYNNGEEFGTSEDGKFTVNLSDADESYNLSATATDVSGRVSEIFAYGDEVDTPDIAIDRIAPVVNVSVELPKDEEGNTSVAVYNNDGCTWYSAPVYFVVTVNDKNSEDKYLNSGIKDIRIRLNNMDVVTSEGLIEHTAALVEGSEVKEAEKLLEVKYRIKTNISALSDGSFNIFYSVTDNAGNTSSTIAEHLVTEAPENSIFPVVYVDTVEPSVKSVEFDELTGYATDSDGQNSYRITCEKGAEITIRIEDVGHSSGINLEDGIVVKFYNVDGSDFEAATQQKTVITNEGYYNKTITFDQQFKGYFTVEMTDNVGHSYKESDLKYFFIVEKNDNEAKEDQIVFDYRAPEFDYGQKKYYNSALSPVITFTDSYAGIKNVEIHVQYKSSFARDEEIVVTNIAAGQNVDKFSNVKLDKNHVSSLQYTVNVDAVNESDDIIIFARLTDNAGHVTTENIDLNTDYSAPVINYNLTSAATPVNNYYSSTVTANVTVVEHNFDASRVSITDGVITGWTSSGDTHTASIAYTSEGAHTFGMTITDKAGNKSTLNGSEGTFYVDNSDPTISVTSIANEEATNEDKVNFTITASDSLCLASSPLSTTFTVWYQDVVDGVTKLVNNSFSLEQLVEKKFIEVATGSGSTQFSYDINLTNAEDVFNDGIYSFVCSVTDMSGRTSSTILCQNEDNTSSSVSTFQFSLNRQGSTYAVYWADNANDKATWNPVTSAAVKAPSNIIIEEVNPTEVMADAVGSKISVFNGINTQEVEVEALKDSSEKYSVYKYVIDREKYFGKDGVYELRVESVDAAGNASDGDKINFKSLDFTIDTTAPMIKTDLSNGLTLKEESHRFSISVEDLTACTLTITDENGSYVNVYPENSNEAVAADALSLTSATKTVYLDIAGTCDELVITAEDSLGQKAETVTISNVTVSTSSFVLMISNLNNNPWIYAVIIGVPVLLAAFIILIAKKRKGNDEKKEKKAK